MWYDQQGRLLPWRIRPEDRVRGMIPDPYAVWLSEIMLQQTTVTHATPYWQRFLAEFPTIIDLANAERERVLEMWAGLGYYARGRNLHRCARLIRDEHGGVFPSEEKDLLKLPGIGPYTAAAMAAICFGQATNVVDGNVERVISRLCAVQTFLPKGRKDIWGRAGELVRSERAADYPQALMDLGGTICTPKNPKCDQCPLQNYCSVFGRDDIETYPKKQKKKPSPQRFGAIFVLISGDYVLMEKRADKGLLGGMLGFPGSDWTEALPSDPLSYAPMHRNWEKLDVAVRHIFTHFDLTLSVYRAQCAHTEPDLGLWVPIDALPVKALPTLMKKVARIGKLDE